MHKNRLNPRLFRAYDVRGLVGSELDEGAYHLMGQAFGRYLAERSGGPASCVLGRDNRPSSAAFSEAFAAGLVRVGCDVTDIGLATTPEAYFANTFLKTTGSAVITASHNPAEYNGVKFTFLGKSAGGKEVEKIRDFALAGEFASGDGVLKKKDIHLAYLTALSKGFSKLNLKVVVDCGNGVSSLFAPAFLRHLGCTVVELHCDETKAFSVHLPDPVDPDNYAELRQAVVREKADAGLMFDGDGDRVGAVDEKGAIVTPDKMLILFARRLLKNKRGRTVVVEIKNSQAVQDEIKKLGGKAVWAPTGRTIIEDVLFEKNAALAGEMSGHFFFHNGETWLSESLYATRVLLEIIAENGPLSGQVATMPLYVSSQEYRIDVSEEEKFSLVDSLVTHFKQKHEVLTLDGAKVLFPHGWGLVRASNSEPKLSIRFESRTKGGLKAIQAEFRRALTEKGVLVPF